MNRLLVLFYAVTMTLAFDSVLGVCWDTGCQLDSWAVRGCAQYDMMETNRKPCDGGKIYSCCSKTAPLTDPSVPLSGNAIVGDITYYYLGLTACGRWYKDDDKVAALAFGRFTTPNPNVDPICGRQVRITDGSSGKSVVVSVQDKCEDCKMNDIDVSPSAFRELRSLSVGRFRVSWEFI